MSATLHPELTPAILESLTIPVLLLGADQDVLVANRTFLEFAGIDIETKTALDLDALLTADARGLLQDSLEMTRMSSGEIPCRLEFRNEKVLHGSMTCFRQADRLFYLMQGQQARAERYLQLNSELFRTQEALLRQEHLAERHQKAIEGLDEFLSVLMHDIRSPLCTVWTSLQLGMEDLERKDYSGVEDMLQSGASSTKRLLDFVDRLYQNVRVGQTELNCEPLDVALLVKELKQDLYSQFQTSGAKLKIVGKLPELNGDRQLVRQLFQNLMQNAMKFRSADRGLVLELGAKRLSGGGFDLYLKDNGLGFPQEDAQRLFERYHKNSKSGESKEANDGIGIGLATCKLIAEKHGWTIRADSKVGEGSVFTVQVAGMSSN